MPKSDTGRLSDEAQVIGQDVETYTALYAVSTSKGGRKLIEALEADIETAIDKLASRYHDLPEQELRTLCADLAVRRGMLQSMHNARDNMEGAKDELDQLTKE